MSEHTYTISTTDKTSPYSGTVSVAPSAWKDPLDDILRDLISKEEAKLGKMATIGTDKVSARVKLHKATIAARDKDSLFREVRHKLAKQLVDSLVKSNNAVKIISNVNPKTGAVTFEAVVEYVKQA